MASRKRNSSIWKDINNFVLRDKNQDASNDDIVQVPLEERSEVPKGFFENCIPGTSASNAIVGRKENAPCSCHKLKCKRAKLEKKKKGEIAAPSAPMACDKGTQTDEPELVELEQMDQETVPVMKPQIFLV
ncbi:uncharacterized protein LOC110176093 [Drosophila serrata]|uniref:uncharacterized protein LOC110176093 n=1 Tax=Drosophila serrata TaxID=7274 RepID=UPI000A1D0BCE|nr:uncharacterized protein LOC110176093 [Drosophila serrata]